MALPKQVEQDLADLEAYEQQLNAEKNPQEAKPDEAKPTEPVVAEVKKPADPPKPTEVKPVETDWEQKYKTLQGMFDSQVPTLHKQNKDLAAQLQQMQDQIKVLQKPAEKTPEPERLVTDKDVTEYGQELIDVQRRVAKEVFRESVVPLQAELAKRDAEISELKASLTKTGGDVATVSFEQRLAQAVPDFSQLNVDPKWVAWLDEKDPYTGEPRRNFAEYVYNAGDVTKLKQVVDFYKESTGLTKQTTERQQRKAELERQITPTRANSQQSTDPTTETRIYTEREMEVGFTQVRKLNTAGKYEEAAKLEAELSLAYMENRVRG